MKKLSSLLALVVVYFIGVHGAIAGESGLNLKRAVSTQIQQLPKAELHLHLGGSYPIEYLRTIATPEQFSALDAGLDEPSHGIEYQKAFFVFGLVSQIVNTDQKVEDGTYALCRSLQADGVVYVEIRTGLKNLGSGYIGYLEAVLRGIKRAQADSFKARLLLSVQRSVTREYAQATVDLALQLRFFAYKKS